MLVSWPDVSSTLRLAGGGDIMAMSTWQEVEPIPIVERVGKTFWTNLARTLNRDCVAGLLAAIRNRPTSVDPLLCHRAKFWQAAYH